MSARTVVFALTVGAAVLAAGGNAAFAARGGGRKKADTIELTRPAGARDADASGTVRITHGAKGDHTTIDLAHLDPRTRYEVHDAATGALLGRVRTNRKGHATFDLTRNVAKAASASGSNAGDVANVDIVDPTTGDTLLTGDVQTQPPLPQFGSADYTDAAGDSADVFMASDPDAGAESFSFEFFPAQDPNATTYSYWDLNADTSNGGTLPLGVASVTELAGRRFEVVSPDGTVVIDDKLPDLQTAGCFGNFDGDWTGGDTGGWTGDPTGGFGGGWTGDWTGGWGGDVTWPTDPAGGFDPNGFANGLRTGHEAARKKGGRKADAANAYKLLIADAQDVLQDAGALTEETFDASADCPWSGPGSTGGSGGGDVFGIVIFLPFDGSFDGTFDWSSFLGDLFGGGTFDPNGNGTTGDPNGNGTTGDPNGNGTTGDPSAPGAGVRHSRR